MAEIAEMAKVRRPTVSNWRRRHDDFPAPTRHEGTTQWFRTDQIADWLDRRPLPEDQRSEEHRTYGDRFRAAARLRAVVAFRGRVPGDQLLRAALALTALRVRIGTPLPADAESVLRLATEIGVPYTVDLAPSDGMALGALAQAVEALCTESGPENAAKGLLGEADRMGASLRVVATPAAVTEMVTELVAGLVGEGVVPEVHDMAAGSGALLAAVLDRVPYFMATGVDIDAAALRICRYRLVCAELKARLVTGDSLSQRLSSHPESDLPSESGPYGTADLVLLDPPFQPSEVADEADPYEQAATDPFRWARAAHRRLAEYGRAIVLVPSWALTRPGREGHLRKARSDLIDTRSVAAVIQLPRRSHSYRTGAELAVLVLTRQPVDDVLLCDLERLDGDPPEHGRVIATALRGDLSTLDGAFAVLRDVAKPASPAWPRTLLPSDHIATVRRKVLAEDIRRATRQVDQSQLRLRRFSEARVIDARPALPVQRIGRLVQRGLLEVIPGARIPPERLSEDPHGVEVIDEEEWVAGPWPTKRYVALQKGDRLAARLTRPGDVLVWSHNGLCVSLDTRGGKLAARPLQVIRITSRTAWMSPTILAAILCAVDHELDIHERDRGLALAEIDLPLLTPDAVSDWTAQIDNLVEHQRELRHRLGAVTELIDTLAIGIGGGSLAAAAKPDS